MCMPYTTGVNVLTAVDYAVITVIVQFPQIAFGKQSVSLYESTRRGVSMDLVLREVLDRFGVQVQVKAYLDDLLARQYLINTNGLWHFTKLCTCGRHSRLTVRHVPKRELFNKEGQFLNWTKEILSGKDLNWTDMGQPLVMVGAKPKEDKTRHVRVKQSKTRKPKTNLYRAKAFNEATVRLTKKDKFLAKIAKLEQMIKENGV